MDVLGVRVDNFSKRKILQKVQDFINEEKFHQISTVNPEFILEASKNITFKKILNDCDLNIADGSGLRLAFWKKGENLKTFFPGADLMLEILKLAQKNNFEVFLVINSGGLSSLREIKKSLLRFFPKLKIEGMEIKKSAGLKEIPIINSPIVFCNFGAPEQEKILYSLKKENYARIRLAMGVGGALDFITKKVPRAPLWMRKIGLEWLWRFFCQPKRIGRIWNATIVFPLKVLFD